MSLLRIAARVSAVQKLPSKPGEGGAIGRYEFDDKHYLMVVQGHKRTWLLCQKSNGKVVNSGTYEKESGEIAAALRETPHLTKVQEILSEVVTSP